MNDASSPHTIMVHNAEADHLTSAEIIVQNNINYTPKVSVIIPVYNSADYLRECLDSVTKQTLQEIEIICIDDGSSDNSLEILKEYASKDNRFTVLTQKNLYAGTARNAGLSVAKGEYLSFLDSDDFFDQEMLKKMYQKISDAQSDIVVCRCAVYMDDTKQIDEQKLDYTLRLNLIKGNYFSADTNPDDLIQICQGFAWDKLFNHEFIKRNNLRFQGIANTNDAQFTFSAMALASSISYITDRLITKRQNYSKSLTSNRHGNPCCFISAIEKIKENLDNYGLLDKLHCSFWNWAISLSLIQLRTLKLEAKEILYTRLHNKFNEWENYNVFHTNTNLYYLVEYIKTHSEFPSLYIAYATNKKFFDLCLTSIVSILKNSSFEKINFIILHSELDQNDFNRLENLKKIKDFSYENTYVDGAQMENYPLVWTSKETWYRCVLADRFPHLDKILYLDSDTIIRKNLLPLWDHDLEGKLFAGVEDISSSKDHAAQLNLRDNLYFNAGVLLMNTKEWRAQKFYDKITDFVINNKVFQADQGTLNLLADNHKLKLSPIYNYIEVWWRKNNCQYSADDLRIYNRKDPVIIHFTGKKPNHSECKNSFKKEFDHYYDVLKMTDSIIPIVLSSSDEYAPFMYTTMLSILESANSGTSYDFYLLVPSKFSITNKHLIKSLEDKYSCHVCFIDMKNAFGNLTMHIKHIASPTYYRLLTANLLPVECDKCIYLDVDVCVCKDLSTLYHIDMGENYVAGVTAAGYYFSEKEHCRRLSLPTMKQYVNAGVLLMNLKQIRKDNVTEKFIRLSEKNYSSLDQDVINVACCGRIMNLPPKFNAMTKRLHENNPKLLDLHTREEIIEAQISPYIVHYADKEKPWNSLGVYMENYWWNIAKKTHYADSIFSRDKIYKRALQQWWKSKGYYPLNLDNPKTFNEKIQWMKLYDSTPVKTKLADKYLVRDWVKEKIGDNYLIPLLGVYDRFEDIDFNILPNQFVIKCNHGCGYNIIVKDKQQVDYGEIKSKLYKWMNENFGFKVGLELHYRDIERKIIIEEYIENKASGGDLYDYKFWCFNGKVKYIQFLSERNTDGLKMAFYDKEWVKQNFVYSYPLDSKTIKRPDNLQEMIALAEKLSEGFNHVRVDFYRMDDGRIFFGEMTFTSASGACKWNDENINRYFGDLIKLPELAYDIDTGKYYKYATSSNKLKPYLLFPYYWLRLLLNRRKYAKRISKQVIKKLSTMRIDIKNVGSAQNDLSIKAKGVITTQPAWFSNAQGIGHVIESYEPAQEISIKTIKRGKLTLHFRSPDKSHNNERFPLWIDIKSIRIDGKEILPTPISVWHDKPFCYEMPVVDGQNISVKIEQSYHPYNKTELRETIKKLHLGTNYEQPEIIGRVYQRISRKSIGHFLFHKEKNERCKKYYLCGIRVWKRNTSIYNYLDLHISRLAQAEAKNVRLLRTEIQCNTKKILTIIDDYKTVLCKHIDAELLQLETKDNIQKEKLHQEYSKQLQKLYTEIISCEQNVSELFCKQLATYKGDSSKAHLAIQDMLCKFLNEIQEQKQQQHKYQSLIKEVEQEIQNLNSSIDKEIKDKTNAIVTAVEREQFLYKNLFEIKTRTKRGFCDISDAPNFEERFRKLISGLPEESVGILVSMLARLKLAKHMDTKMDLYTPEEKAALKLLDAYNRSIFKISENLYCYKNYLLPIRHFEASVFFYRHGLEVLKHPERFMDKAILDVGAFIGDSALILSPLTKDKVYSFEASSENYNLLLKTIELNNLKNIVPVKTAVGAEKSTIEMKVNGSSTTSSVMMIEPKYMETCEVIKVDDYVKENNLKVGLIKVDIEGAEQDFLKGAMQTIKEQKPTLLISIYHNIDDFLDIKPLIESWDLGYKFSIYKPIISNISTETLLVCEQ